MSARPILHVPRRLRSGPGPRRARHGMTLIEVLVAVVILATVLVSLAAYLGQFTRDLNKNGLRNIAGDLVTSRLEFIKSVTRYDAIDAFAVTESSMPGYARYKRVTQVRRVADATQDYKRVTVTVTHPFLVGESVKKTTVVARF